MTVRSPDEIYRHLLEQPGDAEELTAFSEKTPPLSAAVLAEAEQIHARIGANIPLWTALGLHYQTTVPANRLRRLAWMIVLLNAAGRRKRWWCSHAFGIEAVTISNLTQGISFCQRCAKEAERQGHFEDDGHCDVCDQPTSAFYEFLTQDTLGVFSGNVCEKCHGFSKRLITEVVG